GGSGRGGRRRPAMRRARGWRGSGRGGGWGRCSRLLAPFSQAAYSGGSRLARRVLGRAERGGDLVVGKVEAVAQHNGRAFLRRQLVGERAELGVGREAVLGCERVHRGAGSLPTRLVDCEWPGER